MKSEGEMKYDEKKLPVGGEPDKPDVSKWRVFTPKIDLKTCTKDYSCVVFCPHNAFDVRKDGYPQINYDRCTGCLVCLRVCPVSAIFEEKNI
ncbi:MAG: 4Fe-4S binding protein [Candidatus Aenigmarchaeota archaeon]|nr:4Fe-4S binding protein [Candidatus Aenigmarchaeota archaeon]